MDPMIGELDGKGLLDLLRSRQLEELEVLQVLRSPYCTAQVAEEIASDRRLLDGPSERCRGPLSSRSRKRRRRRRSCAGRPSSES